MTLATVAYRISTDAPFTSLLQEDPDKALQQAGITLSADEKIALHKFLESPDQIVSRLEFSLFGGEPWAIG